MSKKYWDKTGKYTVPDWKRNIPSNWKIWCHDTPKINANIDKYISATHEKQAWFEKAKLYSQKFNQPVGYMKEWHKFYHKSFAQWETYFEEPKGFMIWLDSDVKIRKPLNDKVILECLKGNFSAYFDRSKVDTKNPLFVNNYGMYERLTIESGIIIYNLDHPIAKNFFNTFRETYTSMELFNLMDWCDTGAYENAKNKFDQKYFEDINSNLPAVPSPLSISILDPYLEHWMGTANKKIKQDIKGTKQKENLIKNGII